MGGALQTPRDHDTLRHQSVNGLRSLTGGDGQKRSASNSFSGLMIRLLVMLLLTSTVSAAETGYVFVSHERDHTVVVIDPSEDHKIVAEIATSRRPRDMHFDAAHELLYVACGDDDVINVIDVATLAIVDRIETGRSPEVFALSRNGESLYVSEEDSAIVRHIEIQTGDTLTQIATGPEPEGVLLDEAGERLYVASEIADMVHVVNIDSHKVVQNILVGTRPRRFAMTEDERELWVTDELSGQVSIIDPKSLSAITQIPFQPPGFRVSEVTPVGLALSPDAETMFVALGRANHVAFVDVQSKEVEAYVLVGSRPWGIAVSPDGKRLYVANGLSDDTTIVDIESQKASRSIPTGRVPHTVVIDG